MGPQITSARATSEWQEVLTKSLRDIRMLAEQEAGGWDHRFMSIVDPTNAYLNGRLPASALAPISGGKLEKNAAAAWNAMRSYIGNKHGIWIRPSGSLSSYRLYLSQVYFWNLYKSGRGNVAAFPGTSNHGWGKAVDVATMLMATYILRYGHLFGWSHAEGARVGEWWHFTYVGGGSMPSVAKPVDPYSDMTEREERLIREYNKLKAANKDKPRRGEIFRWLIAQRKRIYHEAEHGEHPGWNRAHRRRRYNIIKSITG